MSLILGAPLAKLGYETVALDNLGYGMTSIARGFSYSYSDWVELVVDYLAYESECDSRPLFIYGLSAGGMLAYHATAKVPTGTVKGIVGMTFLDQRSQQVRDETAHDIVTSRLGFPLMKLLSFTPLASLKYPMTMASKMSALVNNPRAYKVLRRDRTSAGNRASIRFLSSYMEYQPAIEPEEFAGCPILLTQPAADRWTPLYLSEPFLKRITRVPLETVMLEWQAAQ